MVASKSSNIAGEAPVRSLPGALRSVILFPGGREASGPVHLRQPALLGQLPASVTVCRPSSKATGGRRVPKAFAEHCLLCGASKASKGHGRERQHAIGQRYQRLWRDFDRDAQEQAGSEEHLVPIDL